MVKNQKTLEYKINNLISLRTTYYSIVIVLTGGLVSLFYHTNILNIVLLVIGCSIDYFFVNLIIKITAQINSLIKLLEEF